jgi:hypothetical protein
MANYSSPSCPADCGSLTLPSYSISTCDDNYTLESSEIQFLYLAAQSQDVDGNPVPVAKPTDWTSAADWAAVLNDTGDNVRKLEVIGDKPATEDQEVALPGFRNKIQARTHTLNISINDMNGTNYTFFNTLATCGGSVYGWIQTNGGYLYGGGDGIRCNVQACTYILERGEGSTARWDLTLQWQGLAQPPRIESPI